MSEPRKTEPRDETGADTPPPPSPEARRPRRPYRPPQLRLFGDVRDVTLGPSPGAGESGLPAVFRV